MGNEELERMLAFRLGIGKTLATKIVQETLKAMGDIIAAESKVCFKYLGTFKLYRKHDSSIKHNFKGVNATGYFYRIGFSASPFVLKKAKRLHYEQDQHYVPGDHMQIQFTTEEKRFIANQIYLLTNEAAKLGERSIYRDLMRVANRFAENSVVSTAKNTQYQTILDMSKQTLNTMINEIIPGHEKTASPDNKTISQAKELVATAESVIKKIEEKFSANST